MSTSLFINDKNRQKTQENQMTKSIIQNRYIESSLNEKQLSQYFKSLKISSISQKKSDFYAYERFINVTQQIYTGDTQINRKCFEIDKLLISERTTQQQQKAKQLNAKKNQILQQLSLLDDQVSKVKRNKNYSLVKDKHKISQSLNISNIGSIENQEQNQQRVRKLILDQKQHKKIISKLNQQRLERQKMKEFLRLKQQEKLKKYQQQTKLMQIQKKQQQKRLKAQEIAEKLRLKKQQHQNFIKLQQESQKKIKQLKNKRFLHDQIQQRYQLNIKMPLLEQQKKILKQKRQFSKAYSIDEIKNHEKNYIELRENSLKKSQAKQLIKSQDHYKAPVKSSKLQKILQQEKMQNRKKLLEKKMIIQQKMHRQQNYIQYLKQKFSDIKIDKSKQDEIRERLQKINKKRQPQLDSKTIGINYLQEAKRKRRKTARTNQLQKQQEVQEMANITALSQRQRNQKSTSSHVLDDARKNLLLKKRQQTIKTLINDTKTNQNQRIIKLKVESDRIGQAFKMKQEMLKYGYSQKVQDQAIELLLTNIQAKMGIIDIYK